MGFFDNFFDNYKWFVRETNKPATKKQVENYKKIYRKYEKMLDFDKKLTENDKKLADKVLYEAHLEACKSCGYDLYTKEE